MKISVITCTWNSKQYIAESIQSVLKQDHPDIEYIFVDGGSTDGTLDLIRAIPGDVVIVENVNGGISRAMNAGIAVASGEVVANLHSDDYYAHCTVLSEVAQAFVTLRCEWLFGRCLSDKGGLVAPESYIVPRYNYRRLLKGNFIPHPATFIKRALLEQHSGFNEEIKYAMDYDLWLRLGQVTTPAQLDKHLAVFRWHPGSLTSANRMASLADDFSVRMKHAGNSPWAYAYHWAHYLVRRRRLAKHLKTLSGAT